MKSPNNLADFVEWDVKNWGAALEFWRTHSSKELSGCSALELGCGRGGLSLWLAANGAQVVCSDLNGPREEAKIKHKQHGVSNLVSYQAIDATNIPYEEEFDVIVFKSALGGIGRLKQRELQARAMAEIHKSLKKGGELYFAENLVASPLHKFLRKSFVQWGKSWRYVSLEEMQEFLQPFGEVEYTTIGFAGTFGRTEAQRNFLGTVDRLLLDRIVPSRWRYIMAGVARK